MFEAVCENKLEVVKELLNSKKIWINRRNEDDDGFTPLHGACLKGYGEMVKLLLENAISKKNTIHLNSFDCNGCRPIYYAIKGNHIDIVRQLIDLEIVEVNCIINDEGNTSLHFACQIGELEMVQLLLEKKANINAVNDYGDTPLHVAVYKDHKNIVKLLISEKSAACLYSKNRKKILVLC